jgi:hypothetical protein
LPAPLQPGGISLIDDATDGTLTINHRVYTFLQSIIPDKGFMGKDWDGTAVSFA